MMNTHHVTLSVWAPPQLSMRWWPVFLRNLLVWRKLAIPSLVGNIAEPLMWLVAFGYGLGALVGEVNTGGQQVPYILFLASGSICMSAMNAASFEALYSAFSRMHMQKTWDGIMNAPVRLDDVVMAEMLWAAYKAIFTVTAIMVVMLALAAPDSPLRQHAARVEVSGETVFLYTAHAQPLLMALQAWPHIRSLHRPANLEDLFLKLTGRQIRENA